MRALVKENDPGSVVRDSNAQAAIVSFTPAVELDDAAAEAAEQQSSRKRTSDLAFKRSGCTAYHSSMPSSQRPVLNYSG